MFTSIKRIKYKIGTPYEELSHLLLKFLLGKSKANKIRFQQNISTLKKKYFINDIWKFNKVVLPKIPEDQYYSLYNVYLDSLFIHTIHNDRIDERFIRGIDQVLPDGPYFFKDNHVNVTISQNDVIIDAGAWIGDFSALASIQGSIVYAFEPSSSNYDLLCQTSLLNKNIIPVKLGLGNCIEQLNLTTNFDLSNSILNNSNNVLQKNNTEVIDITTLDDYVRKNNLTSVDFIKSDIEGYERYLLEGAVETLSKFAPKLSICTYHLPDDKKVLTDIILKANPKYKISYLSNKLFASI